MMTIRPVVLADAAILLEWRNDPLTRRMSKNSGMVGWNDHIDWLTRRLSGSEPNLFIAENPVPIGTFRIDGDQVSYTISPTCRERGNCSALLSLVFKSFGAKRAEIFPDNIASIKAAQRAGHIVVLIEREQVIAD